MSMLGKAVDDNVRLVYIPLAQDPDQIPDLAPNSPLRLIWPQLLGPQTRSIYDEIPTQSYIYCRIIDSDAWR